MCTYNGARFLRQQLESLSQQTEPPAELVICDDRSSDETTRIISQFSAGTDLRVRLQVNEQRLGSTKNFERAIALCSGDVIALCDQDDIWLPGKLAEVRARLEASPDAGAAVSNCEIVDETLRPIGLTTFDHYGFGPRERARVAQGKGYGSLLAKSFVPGTALAFRSELKDLVLPIPTEHPMYIHDRWVLMLAAAVSRVAVIDEPLLLYRQHGGQQIGVDLGNRRNGAGSDAPVTDVAGLHSDRAAVQALLTTLEQQNRHPLSAAARRALQDRLRHIDVRLGLPRSRLLRVPTVALELVRGRYFTYSRGLLSVAKDIARP